MSKFENDIQKSLNSFVQNTFPSQKVKENVFTALENNKNILKNKLTFRLIKAAAVFSFIFTFILSVNISPAFANYLSRVPLISNLVEIVRFDKGLEEITLRDKGMQNAVKSGYGINANAVSVSNNMTFTIENIVSDKKRMFITYSLKYNKEKYGDISSLWFNDMKISGENKTLIDFKNGMSTDLYFKNEFIPRNVLGPGEIGQNGVNVSPVKSNDPDKLFGWIEILKRNDSTMFPASINIQINGWKSSVAENAKIYPGTWDVSFTIPKELINAAPIEYKGSIFNLKAENYNLDFNLDYTRVYPTVTTIKLDVIDPHSSPTSFFLKMHLEDETGRVYKNMEDEFTSSQQNIITEFESCYFTNPKELYLVIESIIKPAIRDPQKNQLTVNKKIKLF